MPTKGSGWVLAADLIAALDAELGAKGVEDEW